MSVYMTIPQRSLETYRCYHWGANRCRQLFGIASELPNNAAAQIRRRDNTKSQDYHVLTLWGTEFETELKPDNGDKDKSPDAIASGTTRAFKDG